MLKIIMVQAVIGRQVFSKKNPLITVAKIRVFRFVAYAACMHLKGLYTVKNAVELFFAFHPDVEKIQYH